ncbi:MAG: sulfatase-like hydrolase/transferase [Acholeplasmataceae bacterium]|nr:sulfatase-like hydrolase/transferase [Acholeplasmataceae bacterium]MCK9427771.1 sulfatase-like hydrolase/transferase [Acholeplasmataceae bacterium]HHT39603.1 sulfatase-like hydrolase/transferase [Acholeplasmataceae bacterium]
MFWFFISLFYLLNIFNTYFITSTFLNRYLISFNRSFVMEVNSFIGNFAVLTILLFLGFLIIRKEKGRYKYMVVLTFLFNVIIFLLGLFTKYYQTVFSPSNMDVFKNPATKLTTSIIIESFKELFVYWRIVVFIPFISLVVIYLIFTKSIKKAKSDANEVVVFNTIPLNLSLLIGGMLLSALSILYTNIKINKNWEIDAEKPLYAVQNGGVYNYYFSELFHFATKEEEVSLDYYDEYNKNKESYLNYYGETYSNTLKLSEANNLVVDDSLKQENLNGIFKDKNLVLVHIESLNHFLLQEDGLLGSDYLETLKALLKESYLFDNFYTNVGVGNSSDAEFAVLTGIHPKGDSTIYWDYQKTEYLFPALPKLFGNDYQKISLHGDVAGFYNRVPVHREMLGFDDYYYYDENEAYYSGTFNGYYYFQELNDKTDEASPWVSDISLLDWTLEMYQEEEKNFLYPIMIQPHVPYLYYNDEPYFDKQQLKVDTVTLRYLNYQSYFEAYFKKFIEISKKMSNTVYLFYSDHGSGIPYKDLLTISNKSKEELSYIEYEKEMLRTLAFLYVPGEEVNEDGINVGLFKGKQPLVRSQVDLYRTVIELFDLETDYYYFGVNGLSKEKTFSIDTRTFSLVTDEYYLVGKRMNDLKNFSEDNIYPYKETFENDPLKFFKYLMRYKYRMDYALKYNLFIELKN